MGAAQEKGTVSVCFVDGVLQGVRRQGLDEQALLEQCGISPALLHLPNARVSAAAYAMLLRLIAQVMDDEFFGLDSRRMKVGSFAMLCRAVLPCRSLDKAMMRALRFFGLMLDDLRGSLSHDEGVVRLRLFEREPDSPANRFAQETLLMFLHRLACWLVNRRIPIQQAAFRYPEPAHAQEYRLLFCSRLLFDQPQTFLAFDPRYFALPVVRSEQALKEFLTVTPENLLVQYKDSRSLATRIHRRLRQVPPEEWPRFEAMAEMLGASPSTLRRRLEAEGQSYQSIKDRLRRDIAINLLSGSTMSVMEIAAELGFAEPSAFHRAFKKWTGANPGEYRRNLGARSE